MFKLVSQFKPTGDQPQAIKKLAKNIQSGKKYQTLLGVTGSGKTFTIANVIQKISRPTLIISHNKTLAAQLYQEFKEFFPENAVHYFVSYYDYYQPEAYIPHTNTYIEKDAKINEEIDRLRHSATQALISRDDVIVIASVSCIYNLGSPEEYGRLSLDLIENQEISIEKLIRHLQKLQYRKDLYLERGTYRNTKNEVEIFTITGENIIKIQLARKKIKKITIAHIKNPEDLELKRPHFQRVLKAKIFPAKYWIAPEEKTAIAIENIRAELEEHTKVLIKSGKILEAERLSQKTLFDLEMLRKTGYCHGIENYSRHLDFRDPGAPPFALLDYFQRKGRFLTIIDESHITLSQIGGMHAGDYSRKSTLIEHGFRLPSALDNRPLTIREFEKRTLQTIYVSATPKATELKRSGKSGLVEQLVRPTGLLDPVVEIRPTKNQIEELVRELYLRINNRERTLITTITKRMAEDLSEFLADEGFKVNYIHSEIKTLDRVEIMRDLRLGKYDIIVGVNLLREGLDLPEVSLIVIIDADKEGFLRNATTLIQTMGRAARNVNGKVIMFADKTTRSMRIAIEETNRRRKVQEIYNKKHHVKPASIQKDIKESKLPIKTLGDSLLNNTQEYENPRTKIIRLEKAMRKAVKRLDYEEALLLRKEILRMRKEG